MAPMELMPMGLVRMVAAQSVVVKLVAVRNQMVEMVGFARTVLVP